MNTFKINTINTIVSHNDATDLSSITGTHATYDDNNWENEQYSAPTTATIYGRKKETAALLESFQKLLEKKYSQTVLVHGESGSGKTTLVDTLREPVVMSQGYFVTGKYIQNASVQEPYSAIMAAFSDLCDLISQSDDFDGQRKAEIQNALGSDVELLAKAITNLTPFTSATTTTTNNANGDDNHDDIITPSSESIDMVVILQPSFTRFKDACASFLKTMASEAHPVVIFLDDVQWADGGSRSLMELFMTDPELKHVMFILAYREDEAAQVADIIQNIKLDSVDIGLTNLNEGAVHKMVCAHLNSSAPNLRSLSNLVKKRTGGQPFHVNLFMDFIIQERLLVQDENNPANWEFSIDKVQEQVMVSETLADLLTRKIEQLSYELKETLKVAALLGYHFNGEMLINIACAAMDDRNDGGKNDESTKSNSSVDTSRNVVLSSLEEAVKTGFIEQVSEGYHFSHDKLQASFQSLLDEEEEIRLHILIGEVYLNQNDGAAMYNAAVHLNFAPISLRQDEKQRKKMAEINLNAAKYCEEKSAFDNATLMIQEGLAALGPMGRWSEEYFDLTFEMMLCLAKNQVIIGNFEGCTETTREALAHSKTIEMKIKVILVDIDARGAMLEVDDGLLPAQQALKTLGVPMPNKVSIGHVIMKLLKVKFMLRKKSDDYLLGLKTTTDPMTTAAMKVLVYMCTCGLISNNQELMVFAALSAMEVTLNRGLSPLSSFAFAIYGVAEVALGNIDAAHRFGKMAMSLLNRTNSQEASCPTNVFVLTIIACWREPIKDLMDPLFQAGSGGFHRGDIFYGSFALVQSHHMQIILGAHFQAVENSLREAYSLVSDMGQEIQLLWQQPYLQHAINMQSDVGNWEKAGNLSGEIMDEEDFFRRVKEAKNPGLEAVALLFKATEAGYFGKWLLAASIYDEAEPLVKGTFDSSHTAPMYFASVAQANFEAFEVTGQRRHLRKARKHAKLVARMGAAGCPNADPFLIVLEAEAVSRKKSVSDSALEAAYNQAIVRLAESRYVNLEGLLCERAGFDFAKREQRSKASYYFERANDLYGHEWGAIAKSLWVQEQSEIVLSGLHEEESSSLLKGQCITTTSNGGQAQAFASI